MVWLTWRQFRAQGIVASARVWIAFAISLAVTGPPGRAVRQQRRAGLAAQAARRLAANFINAVKGSTTEILFYLSIVVL